ncbi:hypothetical protein Tco_1024367, partial [Tanacetum coccineum]
MASGKDVVLLYVVAAWWRPAFNVHRDQGILPLPDDFVLVSMLVLQFLVSETVLRYAILAFWRPAFNILRDHEILPLPNDFVSIPNGSALSLGSTISGGEESLPVEPTPVAEAAICS